MSGRKRFFIQKLIHLPGTQPGGAGLRLPEGRGSLTLSSPRGPGRRPDPPGSPPLPGRSPGPHGPAPRPAAAKGTGRKGAADLTPSAQEGTRAGQEPGRAQNGTGARARWPRSARRADPGPGPGPGPAASSRAHTWGITTIQIQTSNHRGQSPTALHGPSRCSQDKAGTPQGVRRRAKRNTGTGDPAELATHSLPRAGPAGCLPGWREHISSLLASRWPAGGPPRSRRVCWSTGSGHPHTPRLAATGRGKAATVTSHIALPIQSPHSAPAGSAQARPLQSRLAGGPPGTLSPSPRPHVSPCRSSC